MLLSLILANIKMIYRNRQALFWALVFPLIFVVVFGLFRLDRPPTITIGVVDRSNDQLSRALIDNLAGVGQFKIQPEEDEATAREKLRKGDLRYLLLIPDRLAERVRGETPTNRRPPTMPTPATASLTLAYDQSQSLSGVVVSTVRRFLDRTNLELASAPAVLTLAEEGAISRQVDYFDFILPGFVGMGVMNYAIIAVAVAMTEYRGQKILKRIRATPLNVRTFFTAHIIAFLLLSLVQAAVILAAGILLFGGVVYGNYLWLFLLVLLANIVFLNLGFIVGSVAKNVNAASGLSNAVTIPMMFLSGVFFPKDNLPPFLAKAVEFLPLSPLLDALRGVALEAKPFWAFPSELALLGAWIVVTSVVAVRIFKFE